MNIYYVPSTVPDAENTAVNECTEPCPPGLTVSGGRYEKKNTYLAVSGHIGAKNKIKYKNVTGSGLEYCFNYGAVGEGLKEGGNMSGVLNNRQKHMKIRGNLN